MALPISKAAQKTAGPSSLLLPWPSCPQLPLESDCSHAHLLGAPGRPPLTVECMVAGTRECQSNPRGEGGGRKPEPGRSRTRPGCCSLSLPASRSHTRSCCDYETLRALGQERRGHRPQQPLTEAKDWGRLLVLPCTSPCPALPSVPRQIGRDTPRPGHPCPASSWSPSSTPAPPLHGPTR